MDSMNVMSSMHFIVDGSGNYYRINGNNQLVVADGRQNAGIFSYTEANQRIGGGKKAHFYLAIPVEEGNVNYVKEESVAGYVDESKMNKIPELAKVDWTGYLNGFCKMVSGLPKYQEELKQALSEIDLQICDIMHYIELYDMQSEDCYRLVTLLKECREQRRDIKDEMVRIESFQDSIGTMSNVAKAKDGLKQIKKLDTRGYRPRKLDELFENCPEKTVREDKLMVTLSGSTCMDALRAYDREEYCVNEYGEEAFGLAEDTMQVTEAFGLAEAQKGEIMEYTRRQTVFDGQENDWQQFMKQQTEFYANIEQYTMNLQADIKDMEQEIENILTEVDNANYNVAQGYKVLKHLKELRNQKNGKQKELACLYLFIDRFDCKAMAEAMKDCEEGIGDIMGA